MKINPIYLYKNRQKEISKDIMEWTDSNIELIATQAVATTNIEVIEKMPNYSVGFVQTDKDKPIYKTQINSDKTFSCTCQYFIQKNKYLSGSYKKICKHIYLHCDYNIKNF